jgi:hypothetical protein
MINTDAPRVRWAGGGSGGGEEGGGGGGGGEESLGFAKLIVTNNYKNIR